MARASSKSGRGPRKAKPVRSRRADPSRPLLRHTIATLAYRAEKVLRDTPEGFAEFRSSAASRTPLEILSHLGDLMEWAGRLASGEYRWHPRPTADWATASKRFFRQLKALDRSLATAPTGRFSSEVIFQGPVADALTHVGQLSLLRGIAGAPVRPESYARARIRAGRVGRAQSATRIEFDGDASRPQPPEATRRRN